MGARFRKDGLRKKGLRIVQPKNEENRASERAGERGSGWEREGEAWPLTRGHYRKGDYGCLKLSKR